MRPTTPLKTNVRTRPFVADAVTLVLFRYYLFGDGILARSGTVPAKGHAV